MARIAGISIPDKKRVEIALTYIFGVGPSSAQRIVASAGVNPDKHADQLTQDEINRLREILEKNYKIEGDLRREVM
ncbi:MAG: 30S ribosomal protein S13, partial [Candidatus Sungbacteria bacterium]|nr:30S ribosomal protein S13 [Candidatus Sungbacteria bacterium]